MKTTLKPAVANIAKAATTNFLASLLSLFFFVSVSAQSVSNIVKIDTRLCLGTNIIDANVVVFDVAYSNAVDADDAYKFTNPGENIAIQRGTALLVVEGRQPAAANDVIPFKIWNLRQQIYRLEFLPNNFANSPMQPLLEDNFLHTTTPISKVAPTSVNFTVSSNAASSASNRFRIIFAAAAPLPVRFISLQAQKSSNLINLSWKVAAEINVVQYEVERSVDGRQFYSVGTVTAINNAVMELTYRFSDNSPATGAGFYRIKSIDKDGSVQFSSIIKVNAGDRKKGFTVLSNPVSNNTINLQFNNQPAGSYTINLINTGGIAVLSRTINYAGGTTNECISLPSNISTGIYWLRITGTSTESESRMIVIQH